MLWENERWIKLYVRSSPEFLSLSWQARGLFRLILTELDPAGRMVLGKVGLRAVAVAVRASWGEIESPLLELLDDGCLVLSPDNRTLVAPSFVEAQLSKQSDATRQRNKRARDAAMAAVTQCDEPVTPRDAAVTSRDETVTSSHTASRAVTGCHAPLKRDQREEIDQRDQIPPTPLAGGSAPGSESEAEKAPEKAPRSRRRSASTPMPDGWEPTERNFATGAKAGMSRAAVESQAHLFRAKAGAKDYRYVDWERAFDSWLLSPFQQQGGQRQQALPKVQPARPGHSWKPLLIDDILETPCPTTPKTSAL